MVWASVSLSRQHNLVLTAAEASGTYDSPFSKGWYTGVDNLQISKSTTIENAKGGAKADTLIGNDSIMNSPVMRVMIVLREVEETILLFTAVHRQIIRLPIMVTVPILLRIMLVLRVQIHLFNGICKFLDTTVTLATGATLSNGGDSYFEPDLARSYSPVVRENLSLNVDAFPILAKLNIPQIQAFTRGVATGGFSEIPTAEAKVLFTDGLKTEAEIQSALNALDELA